MAISRPIVLLTFKVMFQRQKIRFLLMTNHGITFNQLTTNHNNKKKSPIWIIMIKPRSFTHHRDNVLPSNLKMTRMKTYYSTAKMHKFSRKSTPSRSKMHNSSMIYRIRHMMPVLKKRMTNLMTHKSLICVYRIP